jgi:hypothetical protein
MKERSTLYRFVVVTAIALVAGAGLCVLDSGVDHPAGADLCVLVLVLAIAPLLAASFRELGRLHLESVSADDLTSLDLIAPPPKA